MHIKSLNELKLLKDNQYKKVHHIDLSNEHISVFPNIILKCVNLKKLNLSNTYIQFIPLELGYLKKLHRVYTPKNYHAINEESNYHDGFGFRN